MRDRILEIVLFLIDYIQDNRGQVSDLDDLSSLLESMGYSIDEISAAYSWLMDRVNMDSDEYFSEFPTDHSSHRILTATERMYLSPEAHGFIMKLLNLGLIDDEDFEMILDRLTVVGPPPVSLEQAKVVASSIVFHDVEEFNGLNLFDSQAGFTSHIN